MNFLFVPREHSRRVGGGVVDTARKGECDLKGNFCDSIKKTFTPIVHGQRSNLPIASSVGLDY